MPRAARLAATDECLQNFRFAAIRTGRRPFCELAHLQPADIGEVFGIDLDGSGHVGEGNGDASRASGVVADRRSAKKLPTDKKFNRETPRQQTKVCSVANEETLPKKGIVFGRPQPWRSIVYGTSDTCRKCSCAHRWGCRDHPNILNELTVRIY